MRNISITVFAVLAMSLASTPASAVAYGPTEEVVETTVVVEQTDKGQTELVAVEQVAETPAATASALSDKEQQRKIKQQEKARNAKENDSRGGAITLIAMGIVIMALAVLSILFYCFGKVSTYFQKSRKRKAHGVSAHDAEEHHDELDSGEAIAAIAMALAEHMGQGHDIEDTILTIRRMRKAYSPWNSKIYNLRVVPEHSEARSMRSLKK